MKISAFLFTLGPIEKMQIKILDFTSYTLALLLQQDTREKSHFLFTEH